MERRRYYAGLRYRPGARHDSSLDGTAAVQYAAPGPGRVRVSPLVSRDRAWNNHLEPAGFGLADRKYSKGVPPGSRASLEGYQWLRENLVTPENIQKV